MSTRSNIAMVHEDGKVESIYCHWDGYPSHNGKILLGHYQDKEKVKQLLALGSLSFLSEEIGEKHDFDEANKEHPDWCCAYGRDRGETDVESRMTDSVEEYLQEDTEEYTYVFFDGVWMFREYDNRDLHKLTLKACKD